MNKLFELVEQVRKYGEKEVSSDKLTSSDCLYLYEHGVDIQIDSNRRICILRPQPDFKKDNQNWRYFIHFN